MHRSKENGSPYKGSSGKQPSPDGRHLKELDRLCDNALPKEIALTKKLDAQRKRARQLDTLNTVNQDKVRQLEQEIDAVRKSLLLQIEMYKQMLREQDEEKTRHIKSLQSAYNAEIQRLLGEQDQQLKAIQDVNVEYERKCRQAMARCEELEMKHDSETAEYGKLHKQLEQLRESIRQLEEKLASREQELQKANERTSAEMLHLKEQLDQCKNNHRMEIDSMARSQQREVENLRRQHEAEIAKTQSWRQNDQAIRASEMRDLQRTFAQDIRKLQEQLTQRDRECTVHQVDLKREQEMVEKLTKQLADSVKHNEMLLAQTRRRESEREALASKTREWQSKHRADQAKHEQAMQEVKLQAKREHAGLARELEQQKLDNLKLKKELEDSASLLGKLRQESKQLQEQVSNDTIKIKAAADSLAEENRSLRNQVRTLKAVLLESSQEMEKCKAEFLRMDKEKERMARTARDTEDEHLKLKAALAERELESRHNRSCHYTSVRRH